MPVCFIKYEIETETIEIINRLFIKIIDYFQLILFLKIIDYNGFNNHPTIPTRNILYDTCEIFCSAHNSVFLGKLHDGGGSYFLGMSSCHSFWFGLDSPDQKLSY